MRNRLFMICAVMFLTACNEKYRKIDKDDVTVSSKPLDSVVTKLKTQAERREYLLTKGYQIFDVIGEKTKDTTIMQQYFIAFLKAGDTKLNEDDFKSLQKKHLEHLNKMYDLGYADISGPFGDVGEIREMTIYNVPNIEMADSLASSDPMVKAGHLAIEIHPWWAPKGYSLR